MSYGLIVEPEAEQDIAEAHHWYESRDQGLGSEFVREIDKCFGLIAKNPLAYPTVHRQVRRILLRRFPYGLFYIVEDKMVFVLACFHMRRDPKRWQKRLNP